MKFFTLLLTFFICCFFTKTQNAQTPAVSGVITKGLEVAQTCLTTGKYEKAIEVAENTYREAKKQGETELAALALNIKGKALMNEGRRGVFGGNKARAEFRESLKLLEEAGSKNKELMMDNLEQLKAIAIKNNDAKAVTLLEAKMEMLHPGLKSVNKLELQNQIDALEKENQEIDAEKEKARRQQMELLKTSKSLAQNLEKRQAELELMNQEQLRQELLINLQKNIVDSLEYHNQLSAMELENKEIALKEEQATRNFTIAVAIIVLLVAIGFLVAFLRQRTFSKILAEKNKIIIEEKQRSETLLLNILPALVAEELKTNGHTEARHFDNVTILFADFINFSRICELLSPQELVNELDHCFKAFDEIVQRHQLEKIKTIGDAYMCAGGLPERSQDNAVLVIRAALEMQRFLDKWNKDRKAKGKPEFHARFGVHSGPVVAGVVGSKKFAFDIWGDAVNLASRMETSSESDRINISGETYALVKNDFKCTYRGRITAKNKGEIEMYFVDGQLKENKKSAA